MPHKHPDGGHGHGPAPQPAPNPAYQGCLDGALALLWGKWSDGEKAIYIQDGTPLGSAGISNQDINDHGPGAVKGNWDWTDLVTMNADVLKAKLRCGIQNPTPVPAGTGPGQ